MSLRREALSLRAAICLVVLALAGACARSTGSSPAAPTDTAAVPRIPEISCPSGIQAQSFNGQPVAVEFTPRANGVQPLTVACTPRSGSSFAIGSTSVSCSATDPEQHQTSCTFSVRIFGPPKLSATKFLAFGDSLTAGMTPPDPIDSYPTRLQRKLAGRYITQTFVVTNDGVPGETAVRGRLRLPVALDLFKPDIVLLMEGTNDVNGGAGAAAALDALTDMVRTAKGRGVQVFLATVPPERRATASLIPGFDDGVRALAQREGVVLVDLYTAMAPDPSLIGPDGTHPTQQGLEVMAQTFYDVIQRMLELPPE
jgi:acyl-CoA thioesterase-1